MALSATQWQQLIISQVGDTAQSVVAQNVAGVWDAYAGRALVAGPALQALYTKRDCIDLVLGSLREDVDSAIPGDMASKEDQKTGHLRAMRTEASAEIVRLEARARSTRGGATTPITTVVPISVADEVARQQQPPSQLPDPNDPRYGGWPFPTPTQDAGVP